MFLQVRDGMELTELVPKDTNEHQFLTAQSRYFGFYNMFIITQVSASAKLGKVSNTSDTYITVNTIQLISCCGS